MFSWPLQRVEEQRWLHVESLREPAYVEQGNVPLSPFNPTQVAARQSALQGKPFLGVAGLFSERSQVPAEDQTRVFLLGLGSGCGHRVRICESDSFRSTLYE